MSNVSAANTSSAYRAVLSFKNAIVGDKVPNEVTEELERRAILEIDLDALLSVPQSNRVHLTGSVAIGQPEISFTWPEPFPDTNFTAVVMPRAALPSGVSFYEKSRTTTKVTYGVVGTLTAAIGVVFDALT